MKLSLRLASFITLAILSAFILIILLLISYYVAELPWEILVGAVVVINLLGWLISPYIQDFIHRFFYKVHFLSSDEILDFSFADFLIKTSSKHGIRVPKIGIINDLNPTAFAYGSAAFNARIIITQGLINYLDGDELEAVIAHEVGHIVNRDFIIMTFASTLVQLLYELYELIISSKKNKDHNHHSSNDSKGKGGGILVPIALLAYFFYWIGTYLLLYLSRVREYYADEFAAKEIGDPNILSRALIKVAYGIFAEEDTEVTTRLLKSTRALGISDPKKSKDLSLILRNGRKDRSLMEKAFLFDLVSPWAGLLELGSTHPLIGKRIRRLCSLTKKPLFKFTYLETLNIDQRSLWTSFIRDCIIHYAPILLIFATLGLAIFQIPLGISFTSTTIWLCIGSVFFLSLVKFVHKFPMSEFEETTILECMADIYASPVRGRPVALKGETIGRGTAGFIFDEDMVFKDKTGIIFLNFESLFAIFGNLIFSLMRLKNFLGVEATCKGWFLRGNTHHIELSRLEMSYNVVKSHTRAWFALGMLLLVVLYSVFLFVIVSSPDVVNFN